MPSSQQVAVRRAFRNLKRGLGFGGNEVKGSSLSEYQAAQVTSLLRDYDVILEAVVVDAGEHADQQVTEFKLKQADRLMTHVTRDHQPTLIQDVLAMQELMRTLPNQLFLQAFCMWQLIPRLLETATMYYSQRRSAELGSFVWRVDAKDESVTAMEHIWTTLIGPLITTKSPDAPMGMIPGADYSYFERFDTEPLDGSKRMPGRQYTDMKKVLRDDFEFVTSRRDLGIQMADILASVLTRALNGTLQKPGWKGMGPLLIHRSEQTIHLIALDWDAQEPESHAVTNTRWIEVIRELDSVSRSMLTSRTWRLANEGGA